MAAALELAPSVPLVPMSELFVCEKLTAAVSMDIYNNVYFMDLVVQLLGFYSSGLDDVPTSPLFQLTQICTSISDLRLRHIDHLVTHMCKTTPVHITCKNGVDVDLEHAYETAKTPFRKNLFDAFARNHGKVSLMVKIMLPWDGSMFETRINQLLFFRFAYKCNVIQYAREHLPEIIASLHAHSASRKHAKSSATTPYARSPSSPHSLTTSPVYVPQSPTHAFGASRKVTRRRLTPTLRKSQPKHCTHTKTHITEKLTIFAEN